MMGTEWSPDDDPADLIPGRQRGGGWWRLRISRMGSTCCATYVPACGPPSWPPCWRTRVRWSRTWSEGTPRAWAQVHGLSAPEGVATCCRVEAELPTAFQRACTHLGPIGSADDQLLRTGIDVHMRGSSRRAAGL